MDTPSPRALFGPKHQKGHKNRKKLVFQGPTGSPPTQKWRESWSPGQHQGGAHFEPKAALKEASGSAPNQHAYRAIIASPPPPHPTNQSQSRRY